MQYAKQLVDDLADEIDERSLFVVEEHGLGVYLHRGTGSHAVETGSGRGTRRYLHTIANGKAILAHLPEERVEEILDERGLVAKTPNTITDREELFDNLERIRESGVAFNLEESIEGLNAVAAPVLSPDGEVIGSLGVSGPSHRMKGDWFREEVADYVLGTANELELNLAHAQ
jgi:DNA-binding IclR family transcriptional regulator